MGMPAAKEGDKVVSPADIHMVEIPTPVGPIVVPLPSPFNAQLSSKLSSDVKIMGKPAATKGSGGDNQPQHIPAGSRFINEPSNKCEIIMASTTVNINGNPAARMGDMANTCNDPSDMPLGKVIASGSVSIGG